MATTTDQARFETLRARYLTVETRREALRTKLWEKYRTQTVFDHVLLASERKQREAIETASRKISGEFFALLERVSPRRWESGVPSSWIMEKLTWSDAITAGRLSVTPPCAYGSTQADSVRFAQAVAA